MTSDARGADGSFVDKMNAHDIKETEQSRWYSPSEIAAIRNEAIDEFTALILHGDDTHRNWLRNAAKAFCEGAKMPEATGLGNTDIIRNEAFEIAAAIVENMPRPPSSVSGADALREAVHCIRALKQQETSK